MSADSPGIDLVFVWHHHQPDYRRPSDGKALLPWVRLHATKDYRDMALHLQRHARVKATFNFASSLLDQLEHARAGGADALFELLAKPNYARLEKVGLQYPVLDEYHPGTPFLFSESFPAGRGKFFPLEYIPIAEPPDDEFPFILTTGRLLEHWHGGTMTRNSQLDELYPEALVELHPVDADQLSLKTGDVVRVSSRRGTVVIRARVTEKTTPGVVFIPMQFAEAAGNLLTIDVLDAQAKIPEFKACAVNIQIATEAELPNPEAMKERGRY